MPKFEYSVHLTETGEQLVTMAPADHFSAIDREVRAILAAHPNKVVRVNVYTNGEMIDSTVLPGEAGVG